MFWWETHPTYVEAIHPKTYVFLQCLCQILVCHIFLSWYVKFHMFFVVGSYVMGKNMFWWCIFGGFGAQPQVHPNHDISICPQTYVFLQCTCYILIQHIFLCWYVRFHMFFMVSSYVMGNVMSWWRYFGGLVHSHNILQIK